MSCWIVLTTQKCSTVMLLQPILSRDNISLIRGFDRKIFSVNTKWLESREPLLDLTCGKGFQLQNYRCRQYIQHHCWRIRFLRS